MWVHWMVGMATAVSWQLPCSSSSEEYFQQDANLQCLHGDIRALCKADTGLNESSYGIRYTIDEVSRATRSLEMYDDHPLSLVQKHSQNPSTAYRDQVHLLWNLVTVTGFSGTLLVFEQVESCRGCLPQTQSNAGAKGQFLPRINWVLAVRRVKIDPKHTRQRVGTR